MSGGDSFHRLGRHIITSTPLSKNDNKNRETHQSSNHDFRSKYLDPISVARPEFVQSTQGSRSRNFSSRNTLRNAKSSSSQSTVSTQPSDSKPSKMYGINNPMLLTDSNHYEILEKGLFARTFSQFIYCALCKRRERIRNNCSLERHVDSQAHILEFCKLRNSVLNELPTEDSLHMKSLENLLLKWYNDHSISYELMEERSTTIDEFCNIAKTIYPECSFRLTGSFYTQTALNTSNINLELIHPQSDLFQSDPRAKKSIHHKLVAPDAELGLQINYHTLHYDRIGNALEALHKIGQTIERNSFYKFLEGPDYTILSSKEDLIKKVPRIVIQHPINKCLIEVSCGSESNFKLATILRGYMNFDNRTYALCKLVKIWAKTCNIDDPLKGTLSPETFIILVIYYLQRTSPPVLPCLHELFSRRNLDSNESLTTERFGQLKIEPSDTNKEELDDADNVEIADLDDDDDEGDLPIDFNNLSQHGNSFWNSENNDSVHKLFLGFLRFMIEELSDLQHIISIRTLKKLTINSKRWPSNVKGIENPIKPRVNISRCIGSVRSFIYIKDCFRRSFYYLCSIPLDFRLSVKDERYSDPTDYIELYMDWDKFDFYFKMKETAIRDQADFNAISEMIGQNIFKRDVEVVNQLIMTGQSEAKLANIISGLYKLNFMYPSESVICCRLCKKIGHIYEDCPRGKIIDLSDEDIHYHENLDSKANLDSFLINDFRSHAIDDSLSRTYTQLVTQLNTLINTSTSLDCNLQLYGSTVNKMGSRGSDLDICLTLNGNPTGRGVDSVKTLVEVKKALREDPRCSQIEAILSARVPIIRFIFNYFPIDLSMYNLCALHNSKLLKAYVEIDVRAAQLTYVVKKFAKACGVADASTGCLSSYAWALMVIHYLQRTSPPVLPVLQESNNKTGNIFGVNGWNVWFDENYKSTSLKENTRSLTSLLKGFYRYYSEFDFCSDVISIRTLERMTRYQKNWTNCLIAIEDPFELTYNLAARLDDLMANYIKNTFPLTFKHIKQVQKDSLTGRGNRRVTMRVLFNGRLITDTEPPYRGCRICHRVAHKVKDCPERNSKTQYQVQNTR